MIDWDLRPMDGCGPLHFGMTPREVDGILGPPRFQNLYSPTDFRQSRGKGSRTYDVILGFDPNVLTDATFPAQVNGITVLGLNIFATDPHQLVAALKGANGGKYFICGYEFMFETLGLVLSDWLDLDSSDRWIAAVSAQDYAKSYGGRVPDEIVG